ncbi:hypothetical protein [Acetobacterium sp.]|uniref:hypothetical protein n=1 Tax=Acetobacterium sp. TaxID=1872094 RepID=UPI002F40B03C
MEAISLTASKLQGSAATITKNVEDVRVKTTKEGNSGQNSVNEANSYNKYDTLELSQDYLQYKTKSENSAVTSDVNQLNATITQMFVRKPPQESSDAEIKSRQVDQETSNQPENLKTTSELQTTSII